MRQVACLFAFALALSACTKDPASDESSETAADDPGTEDEAGTEGDTTDEGEAESDGVPDCTPGAWSCSCAEGDVCSPDLVCVDGVCMFNNCPDGFDGCPCDDANGCMDGLFCLDGTCGCMPGSLGCGCIDGTTCSDDLMCIAGECWLMSAYPNCGWDKTHEYYFCGFNIAHPDFPIDCPADLVVDQPCPPELTFEGCCDDTGTWWCQGGVIAYQAC